MAKNKGAVGVIGEKMRFFGRKKKQGETNQGAPIGPEKLLSDLDKELSSVEETLRSALDSKGNMILSFHLSLAAVFQELLVESGLRPGCATYQGNLEVSEGMKVPFVITVGFGKEDVESYIRHVAKAPGYNKQFYAFGPDGSKMDITEEFTGEYKKDKKNVN